VSAPEATYMVKQYVLESGGEFVSPGPEWRVFQIRDSGWQGRPSNNSRAEYIDGALQIMCTTLTVVWVKYTLPPSGYKEINP